MTTIDRLSSRLGWLAAWLYFCTGLMIGYEVVARYFFNAPTIWAAELSQLLLIWGTFLAMAFALRRRQHIRIEIVVDRCGPGVQRLMEGFALVFIACLCAVVIWYGWGIAWDSLVRGRSTGTMLNIPNWWTEVVIPFGFGVLLLQCLVELRRLFSSAEPEA
jgi:TRAP-type C4-dicarboxylate transport system permease small subunit